ncbi:MAG TPA: thiamine pyrophosphate-binding protein [Candidatus Methylomirabilis sp.]|nr:thiamine pyrophosphate-binding protein [Candidatus Methylomirabilis sp.]
MRLTGSEIIVEYLIRQGVPYICGIPGHGNVALLDAVVDRQDQIKMIQVMHEQSGVHLADAYYRVSGKPLAVTTSIGPGAMNTVIGMAQAYVDSTAVLLITGSTHTYMRGHTVLQEIERVHWSNFPRVLEPIVKRYWQVSRTDQLPYVMHRAFNQMLSGRPGPVLVDLPMDVAADTAEVELPDPEERVPQGRMRPDAEAIQQAGKLLLGAKRPVLLAGGGVITANASRELQGVAEFLGAAVTTTWMGKGAFPEDHPLYCWHPGDTASTVGNAVCRSADVLLAVGCRFTDWVTSSLRDGVSFAIPPTRLIQIDVDPHEIGKNYPTTIGILADAKAALGDLLAQLKDLGKPKEYTRSAYFKEIQKLNAEWERVLRKMQTSPVRPMTISRALQAIRGAVPRDTIVVTGAGLPQGQVWQEFPVYAPRTHITSGGFSTMGFTVPGAIGAKLAAPGTPVVGIAGDGDFMQTMQEMGVAAQLDLPVVFVVMNNCGFRSIMNLQFNAFGEKRLIGTCFEKKDGSVYSADFAACARAFGLEAVRVEEPDEVGPAVKRALASGGPSLVEVMTARTWPQTAVSKSGWWDVPIPAYLPNRRKEYEKGRGEEKL